MADTRQARNRRLAAVRAVKQSAAPMPVRGTSKATGWKIPLCFCAAILVAVAAVWGWREYTAPPPLDINPRLMEIAGQSRFDLEADRQGRRYSEDLIAAGRGFAPNHVKDQQVEKVAWRALDDDRLDVVVMAVQVIRDPVRRDRLLKSLAGACMEDCAMLPWGVYAVRNLQQDYPAAVGLARGLNERWEQCLARGTPPRPTTSESFAPRDTEQAVPAPAAAPADNVSGGQPDVDAASPVDTAPDAAADAAPEEQTSAGAYAATDSTTAAGQDAMDTPGPDAGSPAAADAAARP